MKINYETEIKISSETDHILATFTSIEGKKGIEIHDYKGGRITMTVGMLKNILYHYNEFAEKIKKYENQ